MYKLAADPYYFNTSKHFNKAEFIEKDVWFLSNFFNKSEEEIYEASKSFIGRENRLFAFNNAVKFWYNALEVQLTDQSTTLSTLVTVFAIEAMVGDQISGKGDRYRCFLLNYLSRDEKIELLSSYTFGTPYSLGEGRFRKKHLCYRAVALTQNERLYNRSGYCTSGEHPLCTCRSWLNEALDSKINRYLNMFGEYFYQMRSSVVHDASFVRFTTLPYFDNEIGNIVPTTADAYSNNMTRKYTSYDTDLAVQRFHQIMKLAAWRAFERGCKIRFRKKVHPLERL